MIESICTGNNKNNDDDTVEEHREQFLSRMNFILIKKNRSKILFHEQYYQLIDAIRNALMKAEKDRDSNERRLLRTYQILFINDEIIYLIPNTDKVSTIEELSFSTSVSDLNESLISRPIRQRFLFLEEMFDILIEAHRSLAHAGRKRMYQYLRQLYPNITVESIETFLQYCRECQKKRRIRSMNAKLPVCS